jgi:hypothetical protein
LWVSAAQAQNKISRSKVRLAALSAIAQPLADSARTQKGFYARHGFDVEIIQLAAGLVAPVLLNRAIDYTTIPNGPATAGARRPA